jgi:hypothetical protein
MLFTTLARPVEQRGLGLLLAIIPAAARELSGVEPNQPGKAF